MKRNWRDDLSLAAFVGMAAEMALLMFGTIERVVPNPENRDSTTVIFMVISAALTYVLITFLHGSRYLWVEGTQRFSLATVLIPVWVFVLAVVSRITFDEIVVHIAHKSMSKFL